jgi:hypothetical protein
MPTLQTCVSAAARTVPDVPGAITATRQTNAQVKARELIIILVNFVFIGVISFHCFGLPWLPTAGGHIWPFTPSFGKFCPALQKRRFFRASRRNQRQKRSDPREHRLAEVALPLSAGSSAMLGDGLAEACQRSLSSYEDPSADGTAGLAGHKARALVRGEAASGASVPARSADNGPGIHMAKIAVVA